MSRGLGTYGLGQWPSDSLVEDAKIPWRARGHAVSRAFSPTAEGPTANGAARTMLYEQTRYFIPAAANNLSMVYHNIRNAADGYAAYNIKTAAFTGVGSSETAYGTVTGYEVATWSGGSDSSRLSPSIPSGGYRETNQMVLDVTAGQMLIARAHATWASAPADWPKNAAGKYAGDEVKEIQASFTERINSVIDWAGGYYSYDVNAYGWLAPSLVIGDHLTRIARVAVLHDSFGNGSGDSDAGGKYAGWPQKLLATNYPWYFFGSGGWTLFDLINGSGTLRRFTDLLDLGGFTHVILQLGTNDIASGQTAAAYMANVALVKAALDALPLKPRLILTTPPPRTNSGNTAVTADYAQRKLLDAAIRAGNGVGYGFIDSAVLFAGGDINVSGLWVSGGSGDGVHPDKTRHEAVVAANVSALPTLLSVAHYA